ncbi:MAG TPA: PilZ domain-containing protein [Burkholderiales bacterium]
MERRWGIRKSVDVEVVIDCQPRGLLRGRLGNVSVGGLFVRTEPSVLTRNTHVEVVLMLQHADGTRVYRMPALVVRLSPNGVGLMLDQYDVEAFRALVVLLLAQREAGARLDAPYRSHADKFPVEAETTASAKEDVTGAAVSAADPITSVSQLSPACGESH